MIESVDTDDMCSWATREISPEPWCKDECIEIYCRNKGPFELIASYIIFHYIHFSWLLIDVGPLLYD